jgi:hypothetical protein
VKVKRHAPAAERNKDPILAVLQQHLPPVGGLLLELASGTGQHALHYARHLPAWRVQPSDVDEEALESVAAYREEALAAGVTNLLPPLPIDVRRGDWGLASADAIVSANMTHISPWASTLGLLDGAARLLATGGPLFLYGPFMRGGQHTARSNAEFDASLRGRDPSWGVRDADVVADEARRRGLVLEEVVSMPANNLTLVLRRT